MPLQLATPAVMLWLFRRYPIIPVIFIGGLIYSYSEYKVEVAELEERRQNTLYYHSDKVWRKGPEQRVVVEPDVRRQSLEDAANFVFLNDMDKQRFYMTEHPEINEPANLERYIDTTIQLCFDFDTRPEKISLAILQRLKNIQEKGDAIFSTSKGHMINTQNVKTLSCEYLFQELNAVRDAVHALYTDENRPYKMAEYPPLTYELAEEFIEFR